MSDEPTPTEAVPFDPFADETQGVQRSQGTQGTQGTQATPHTEAVPFDPFADDDDDTFSEPEAREDTSTRARREALSTFRSRHGVTRSDRPVADGMVHLPFVPPTPPTDALIDPAKVDTDDVPQLKRGDIVADQYEILGVMGHGGMGWIYLANDHYVSERLVVLKGMQSSKSQEESAVAEAEREFLAGITHPGIVKIYNFIDDPRVTGGFIVMEFVGGPSLRQRRTEQKGGLFDPDIAIGYILEILPAVEYLHSRGVVYNDLKPSNIIITEDQVKLIDLGAVSGIGAYGFIYGTKGFQAPEVSTDGPSVASDIYTIGRTLATLTVKMPTTDDGILAPALPTPTEEPTFRRYLSLWSLIRRATDPDPKRRFQSITELQTQLYGVLREIRALRDNVVFPSQHPLFSPQRTTFGTKHLVFRTDQLIDGITRTIRITSDEVEAALPVPLIDRTDPGAGVLSGTSYAEPQETLETLRQAYKTPEYAASTEIPLGVVRALLDLGLTSQARTWLANIEETLGADWRFQWYAGITALLSDDYTTAQARFAQVMRLLPGEPAPKLALAAVDELILQSQNRSQVSLLDGDLAIAASGLTTGLSDVPSEALDPFGETWNTTTLDPALLRLHCTILYGQVWAANPTTVSSAFGLSRQLMSEGQIELAVAALDKVPQNSRHQRMASLTTVIELVSGGLDESHIRRAARRLGEIPTNEPRFLQIKIAVLSAALDFLRSEGLERAASPNKLFEYSFSQHGMRYGLSDTLRAQARLAPYPRHRYALVDMANQVRSVTWF